MNRERNHRFSGVLATALLAGAILAAGMPAAYASCESDCRDEFSSFNPQRALCLAACKAKAAASYAKEKVGAAVAYGKKKVKEAVDYGKEKVEQVKQKIVETGKKIADKAEEAYEKGKELYKKGKEYLGQVKQKIKNIAKGLWDRAKGCVANGIGGCIKKLARGAWDAAKQCYSDGWYGCLKKVAKAVANAACQGVGIFWDAAARCCKKRGAWGCIKEVAKKGKQLFNKGKQAVKSAVKKAFDGLADVDCGKIVQAMSKYDVMNVLLKKVSPTLGKCRVAMTKGFICHLPNLVKDVATFAAGAAEAAWQNRSECGKQALLSGPMAPTAIMTCGVFHYLKPKVQKAGRCVSALGRWIRRAVGRIGSGGGGGGIGKLLRKVNWGALAEKAFVGACSFIGGVLMDVLIAVGTGGGSLPSTVGGWVRWVFAFLFKDVKKLIKELNPMVMHHRSVKLYNLIKGILGAAVSKLPSECGGAAVPLSFPPPPAPPGRAIAPPAASRRPASRRPASRRPANRRVSKRWGAVPRGNPRQGRRPTRIRPKTRSAPAATRCVTGSGVTYRSSAGGRALGVLYRGAKVALLQANAATAWGLAWSKIDANGKVAFMASQYLGACR